MYVAITAAAGLPRTVGAGIPRFGITVVAGPVPMLAWS
jgi:hypothetical protein